MLQSTSSKATRKSSKYVRVYLIEQKFRHPADKIVHGKQYRSRTPSQPAPGLADKLLRNTSKAVSREHSPLEKITS
jgi:hypothetical protein